MRPALLLAALLLAACSSSPSTPPAGPPGPGGPGPGPGPGPSNPPPVVPGGGDNTMLPVSVSLEQIGTNAATGETDLQLVLDVNSPPSYPLSVTATAPAGAQLVGGQAQESLTIQQKGRITRQFRVRGPLTAQSPFVVVVDGRAPNGSSGLHADKKFPPPPEATAPKLSPPPPGGRPPGPVPRLEPSPGGVATPRSHRVSHIEAHRRVAPTPRHVEAPAPPNAAM